MNDEERARRFAELNRLARLNFLDDAVVAWETESGRPPTTEELRRILARYPGDPMVVPEPPDPSVAK